MISFYVLNILVGEALAEAANDLVGDGVAVGSDLFRGDARAVLLAEDHGLIVFAHARYVCNVGHTLVHTDSAYDRGVAAAHEDTGVSARVARQAVAVAQR